MTKRELTLRTLEFRNKDQRAPRQLWPQPWAFMNYPEEMNKLRQDFPDDIWWAFIKPKVASPVQKGDPSQIGEYTDDWGCSFVNIHAGIMGEVKEPIIDPEDEDWEDTSRIHIPTEWLTWDKEEINAYCASTDQFVLSGVCPRPFEQLQFIRGTESLYLDLALQPSGMFKFLEKMHSFYCDAVELWCQTDVDAICFMDDWGSQNSMLISPDTWEKIFMPLYKDYIDIAHRYGKKAVMHSDGNILKILPHLVDLKLDALNSQIFCMDVEKLASYKGKICFWGEIDRQHILPEGSLKDVQNAVQLVYDTLWDNGGCIAQCEFGPGAKPENVYEVFKTWDKLTTR